MLRFLTEKISRMEMDTARQLGSRTAESFRQTPNPTISERQSAVPNR